MVSIIYALVRVMKVAIDSVDQVHKKQGSRQNKPAFF